MGRFGAKRYFLGLAADLLLTYTSVFVVDKLLFVDRNSDVKKFMYELMNVDIL